MELFFSQLQQTAPLGQYGVLLQPMELCTVYSIHYIQYTVYSQFQEQGLNFHLCVIYQTYIKVWCIVKVILAWNSDGFISQMAQPRVVYTGIPNQCQQNIYCTLFHPVLQTHHIYQRKLFCELFPRILNSFTGTVFCNLSSEKPGGFVINNQKHRRNHENF